MIKFLLNCKKLFNLFIWHQKQLKNILFFGEAPFFKNSSRSQNQKHSFPGILVLFQQRSSPKQLSLQKTKNCLPASPHSNLLPRPSSLPSPFPELKKINQFVCLSWGNFSRLTFKSYAKELWRNLQTLVILNEFGIFIINIFFFSIFYKFHNFLSSSVIFYLLSLFLLLLLLLLVL